MAWQFAIQSGAPAQFLILSSPCVLPPSTGLHGGSSSNVADYSALKLASSQHSKERLRLTRKTREALAELGLARHLAGDTAGALRTVQDLARIDKPAAEALQKKIWLIKVN